MLAPGRARQQICHRLVEPAAEKVGLANHVEIRCHAVARAELQIVLKMLDRDVGLAGKNPEQSAPVPTTGMTWVERQTTVNQCK
jgi:hypothetical protein